MTSTEIRSSFLKFFASKKHSIVPPCSLLPDYPNLLFTNAGMNQFVPIFLGTIQDLNDWPGAQIGLPTRAVNTQKCIRAGGKHNDLDDVGLDTYHHTFFEMLGNWSFGDYFKKEAIEWAWELIVHRWHFPPHRLHASFYQPGPNEPSETDDEACECWSQLFRDAGLNPSIHVHGGMKKDNFWTMGETGPCGPCSELHIDLTPAGDSGNLVHSGSALCMEIWNLVFIQFNISADGTISLLPQRHVDTGMGLERIAAIIQCTQSFTDFSHGVSNYDTDLFLPLLQQIERLSEKKYAATLPSNNWSDQERIDVAFRVIADHIRTLSFAISDGILPSNTGRGYVLRRLLRRAIRYSRVLDLREHFFNRLVTILVETMGSVFPELTANQSQVEEVIRLEEAAFHQTLDSGLQAFTAVANRLKTLGASIVPGEDAFRLADTYGFPIDLTQMMAREIGFSVDQIGFHQCMEQQRSLARTKQKIEDRQPVSQGITTQFVGYESLASTGVIHDICTRTDGGTWICLDQTSFYPTMGGQIGDSGYLKILKTANSEPFIILTTVRSGGTFYHHLAPSKNTHALSIGMQVQVVVDAKRRRAIERHHTATHLLHWALREVVSRKAMQHGSYVGPEKLTFDLRSSALTQSQLFDIEQLVNERILENARISWRQLPLIEIQGRADIMQVFSEKYSENIRVVQIGGDPELLNGYSMELCAGTHCKATGELGILQIVSEGAVAAGVRRIEATAGCAAHLHILHQTKLLCRLASRLKTPVVKLEQKLDSTIKRSKILEKQLRIYQSKQAHTIANFLLEKKSTVGGIPTIVENVGEINGEMLEAISNVLKEKFNGIFVLGSSQEDTVALIVTVPSAWKAKISARDIMQEITPIVGGNGGGGPELARGRGRRRQRLDEALQRAIQLLCSSSLVK